MERQEALDSIETIRTVMERTTLYRHISPMGLLLAGVTGVLASMVGALLGWTPIAAPGSFFSLWGAACLAALGVGLGTSMRRARRLEEAFVSRKLQFVLGGVIPALLVGGVLTALCVSIRRVDLCPGIWMLTYGVAILSVGVVLDWEFRAAAWAFLIAGTISLFLWIDWPSVALGASFGGIHIALGLLRTIREARIPWHGPRLPSPTFKI